jgi:hypothetical protein
MLWHAGGSRVACRPGDPVFPKAVIRLVVVSPPSGVDQVQAVRFVTWAEESLDRKLVGCSETLQDANSVVLFDVPDPESIVKGLDTYGMYRAAPGPRPRRAEI